MASQRFGRVIATALATASIAAAATCDTSTLNTTTYLYPITVAGTTIADVANATGRGLCNIARYNFMADQAILPNVGQEIAIPAEVCPDEIDDTTCVIDNYNSTNTCLIGGPRLYYTVNGDTYTAIANRLNLAVTALSTGDADEVLEAGQFVKVPLCDPSQCSYEPFQFTLGEPKCYKDLADEYGVTVGQIMQLSPTYNYSQSGYTLATPPTIDLVTNCTYLSDNITVIT
ncbi:hypothetical protein M406DRAFT_331312 [Cryphonectria parasitica EP155]|uniref:LysM domain-containing protein n=2 Tax=Cryphonectria parasitica TaxID=5116 RepID=A0A9P4Y1X5_CRYP1|nr:uncharacterized protein M406DRAFT_331312 [Cryphonectria parasitica EP155]APB03373.1 LM12 [Cryphonectria parasitica]KAF3764999.1 hypothetical protein M406DRAFT_331312 [Cryphonectria parasitica EP155]